MTKFVLDASVALRWFLDKTISPYAKRIRQMLMNGDRGVVPALWHLEIANAIVVAERRRLLSAADVDQALREIEQLIGLALDTDSTLVSVRYACGPARSLNLSAYDATYLSLAKAEGIPLATLDNQLRGAARQEGVQIL